MTTEFTLPTLFGRATAIIQEHADLRPIVAELRKHATELALGRLREDIALESLLDEFFDELLAHFAAEENEGYFGTFIEDYPELSVHVERLMAEHEDMVDAVERLRALSEDARRSADLGLALLSLLARFEGHEHEENALMRAFLSMVPTAGQGLRGTK